MQRCSKSARGKCGLGSGLLSCMDINGNLGDASPPSSKRKRNVIFLIAGICILSASALAYLILHRSTDSPDVASVEARVKDPAAELVSATGMVLAGKPGRDEWSQITVGARLMEGDRIQTDTAGRASIQYANGNTVILQENTVLTVHSAGDGSMEISVSATDAVSDFSRFRAKARGVLSGGRAAGRRRCSCGFQQGQSRGTGSRPMFGPDRPVWQEPGNGRERRSGKQVVREQ